MAEQPRVARLHFVQGAAESGDGVPVADLGELAAGDGTDAGVVPADLRLIGSDAEPVRSARLAAVGQSAGPRGPKSATPVRDAVDLERIGPTASPSGRVARLGPIGAGRSAFGAGAGADGHRAGREPVSEAEKRPSPSGAAERPPARRARGTTGRYGAVPAAGRNGAPTMGADLKTGGAASGSSVPVGEVEAGSSPRPARRPPGPKQIDPDADPVVAAKDICLDLLSVRARTKHELAEALRRRGVPDEAAATALDRFDEVGLIDDVAFAGQWVRSRQRTKGLARRALAMELRRKGVDDEVAGEALAEVDADAEEQRARELVDRKLRIVPADTPEQRVSAARRLVGMLARKGYGGGIAYRVVREALAAHGADVDELGSEPS